jgi:aryl-alcohol dehydrogenase-like predicted oxidoreductase
MAAAAGVRRIGFGCARITTSPAHIQALSAALEGGVRVLDAAPNYGHDGAAERAVGQAVASSKVPREELHLGTKFGYYASSKPGPESVPIGPAGMEAGLHFSLHPEVLERELTGSLDRMRQEYVDTLYVHNPEHFLADIMLRHERQGPGVGGGEEGLNEALRAERAQLKDRLVRAFEALEGHVASGRIRRYGVSSNGFALSPKEQLHLSLDMVLDAAREGARRAGKAEPALGVVQLPVNLLEPSGLVVASQARGKGLDVVANRPLTAVTQGNLYRLVNTAAMGGQGPPSGYMEACRAALDLFNPSALFGDKAERCVGV